MDITLSNDELNSLSAFSKKIIDANRNRFSLSSYQEEGQQLIPIIRSLLEFGINTTGDSNLKSHYQQSLDFLNAVPSRLFEYLLTTDAVDSLNRLIRQYHAAVAKEKIDELMDMKIVDMTGEQFQRYLRLIGIVK
ncbi:hypothetical protein [Spirosoma panaciterrae]|uniref:hypothetical protein n=1 Tax=Spirosoma panaciterrae TaxID=496058 RepID=UPI000379A9DC|nr:hypothetical protein [Spirosoma panaciterrae]